MCQIMASPVKTPRGSIARSVIEFKANWPGNPSSAASSKHFGTALSGVFQKQADLKPHRDRYGLTPKPDPDFETKCADICAVYQAAPAAAEQGADRLDRRNDRYPGAGTGRQELANEAWAQRTA